MSNAKKVIVLSNEIVSSPVTFNNEVNVEYLYTDNVWEEENLPRIENESDSIFPEENRQEEVPIEDLIDAVRQHTCLWDICHKEYRNKTIRLRIWEDIAVSLDTTKTNAANVKKKKESLKSCYLRSKKATPSGSCKQAKEYKFAKSLAFLDDTFEPRATSSLSNMETPADDSFERRPVPPRKRKNQSELIDENLKIKKQALEILAKKTMLQPITAPVTRTSHDIFGEYVASQLKSMNEDNSNEAEMEIMEILYKKKKLQNAKNKY